LIPLEKALADKLVPGKGVPDKALAERPVPAHSLPSIPAKRYFTIGEVSELCGVKPYVLRYWEQEFTQLKPMKRRGNRRYYQHHEVLLIRRIRDLLYDQGFTISGARNRLTEGQEVTDDELDEPSASTQLPVGEAFELAMATPVEDLGPITPEQLRAELLSLRDMLAEAGE
jgi:DNA-binding transcriptional MerR regulator